MRFVDLSTATTGRKLTQAELSFTFMIRDLKNATESVDWVPKLRPSRLPQCQWASMLGFVMVPPPQDPDGGFLRDYYTEVGKTVHKVLQNWLGRLGYLYGPYRCKYCRKVQMNLGVPKEECCPVHNWEYTEISLKDLDPSGELSSASCDGLIHFDWMAPDTYYLIDVKTCSLSTLPKTDVGFTRDYHVDYKVQTAVYRYLLAQAGVNVVGTAFLMVPRDAPHKTTAVLYEQPEDEYRDIFDFHVSRWKRARKAAKTGNAARIHRDCKTAADRPECPFNKICFDRTAQEDLFKQKNLLPILPEF